MKGIKRNKTVIALAVAAVLSAGIAGCDGVGSKTDIEHVAAAKDFLDKNDLKSGVIELKSALQKNPKNAEARRLLGELNLDAGNGPAAEKELKRALELGVAKEAILASLAEALAIQGKYQEILDQIEAPANLDAVEKAEIISYRGDAWLSKRKPEKARAEYERALEVDPASGKAKLGLAKLAVANKKSEEADQLITEALKSSPEDSNIWLFQAELQRAKGEIDKAEESYGQAIKLNARNLMARYQRALLRIGKKDFESAEKDIEVLKKEAPKSFQRHYAEGLLAFYQKKFPEAQEALDEALKINSNFVQAILYRGASHLAQKHLAQAENDLSRVQNALPNQIKPRQLLAQVLIERKAYKEAKALLDPVINFKADDPVTLNLLGNVEFGLKNNDKGVEYLQKLAEIKPENADVHARLGLGMLQLGEKEKGIEQLEKVGELVPGFVQGDAFIFLAHLKAKEFDKAEKVIEKIKTKQPGTPLAGNLAGILYKTRGESEQAKMAFESVFEKFKGNPAAGNALADMALKDKDYLSARKFYNQVLAKHPKHLKTKLRLAALEALENKPKKMEAQLKSAISDHPQALAPRLILASYYTRYGQAGRALTLLEEVSGRYGDNIKLLSVLFNAQLKDKNVTRALKVAKKLADMVPKSAQAQFMLAMAYEVNRDLVNMRVALNKSLELSPKNVRARMAMIRLMTLEGEKKEAGVRLAELVRDVPDRLEIINLQGWFALRNSKPEEAISFYQELLRKQASSEAVISLSRAKWMVGEKEESVELLSNWVNENPNDIATRYYLSSAYGRLNDYESSIKELVEILRLSPEHTLAMNDLAWKLRKKEPKRALEYAEKAYEKAPKSVSILDTLAMVLLENGQYERALFIQEQAVKKSPQALALRYHLAIILKKNNQTDKALRELRGLLAENKFFKERVEAEAFLKKLEK